MLKAKRKSTNSLRSDSVDFRFNAKLRNLRISKSLQSQNPQTISGGLSPRFLGCASRFLLNLLTLVHGGFRKIRLAGSLYPGKRAFAPVKNVADAKFAEKSIPAH